MGELRNLTSRLAPHPPKPPEPSASKAGRNLKAAVPVAFGLLGLVAFSVLWRIEVFVVLVAAALCVALWEVAGAFLNKGRRIPLLPLWCGILAMVGATWARGPLAGLAAYCVAAVAVILWRWAERGKSPGSWSGDAAAAVFALGWVGLLGSFAVALAGLPRAEWMVALLVLMPAFPTPAVGHSACCGDAIR